MLMKQNLQSRPQIRMRGWVGCAAIGVIMLSAGCYKELPPQERVQAPTPPPAVKPAPAAKPTQQTVGVGQPASSALGSAKRSAENTIHQAEQASQKTADSVDKDN